MQTESRRQMLQVRFAARRFLAKQNTSAADEILMDRDLFDEFVETCIEEHCTTCKGPLADVLASLIKSFVENPEQWIKVITLVIGLFSEGE